jgi:hypothetical protein
MRSREMYGHYRQLIEELSNKAGVGETWFDELKVIAHQFELDAANLARSSAQRLCDELCDQFEQEAYQTDTESRRKVLMAATKLLELQRPSTV